jgi:hypothetical protein
MGLDAVVYCDCYERGRLRTQPNSEWNVYVCCDGSRDSQAEDLETQMEFDQWSEHQACEHRGGILLHHRIGNIAAVGVIRGHLWQRASTFPLIIDKVIYSGMHTGDYLVLDDVRQLQSEVDALCDEHSDDEHLEAILRVFEHQMRELCDCALRVGKPIAF